MQYQKEIHDYLKHHQQEILALLEKLVAVRSVQGEAQKNAPFGSEPAKALHIMLETCQQYGFSTDNVDFYAGSADLNDKKPSLGILAHLDVVPEGDGWTHQPYQMEYEPETDKLYGRGTSDDKGPAVAALFAMKAVKDLQKQIKKRFWLWCRIFLLGHLRGVLMIGKWENCPNCLARELIFKSFVNA